jgi:phosphatidylinositol glycan class S
MMQAANHVRQAQRSGLSCKQHAASRQHRVALGIMAGSNAGRRTLVIRAAGETMAPDSYCCVGLSHCFTKNEDGRLGDVLVIEPISSSSLECMATGAKTSFKAATGLTLADAAARDKSRLPEPFQEGMFCDEWSNRLQAAARTWQRPHAQDNLMDIVPLGKVRLSFNFNLDNKRVLNFENVVTDDDNVKQDMSIDVYGRADKKARDETMAKAAAEAEEAKKKEKEEQETDELDALLAA